jgi:hypothetical protein
VPTDQETFEAMVATTQKYYPKYKVVPKAKSSLHKFIGWILKTFTPNKVYMTHFWTYFGNKNAYPIEETEGERFRSYRVHAHEGTHAGQEKKWTSVIWGSLYLLGTPVPAVVLGLLAIPLIIVGALVSALPWWVGLLVLVTGLVLSSPVPFAYWRSEWELQAYGVSVATLYWTTGKVDDSYIEAKTKTFAGGEYFYMNVFKKKVRKRLEKARDLVMDKKFITTWEPRYGDFYSECYRTLKDQGRVKI